MVQCAGDVLFPQARPVVAFDQQRDAAAIIDMARPSKRRI
jgi:hypothetical protein